jgi:hypothetical protein
MAVYYRIYYIQFTFTGKRVTYEKQLYKFLCGVINYSRKDISVSDDVYNSFCSENVAGPINKNM